MSQHSTVPHDTDRPAASAATDHDPPETAVPADEEPVTCPYCGQPFRESATRALHVGEQHADAHSPAEGEAYESAREAESDELFMYHLRVIAALGVLYAVLVLLYMIVLA